MPKQFFQIQLSVKPKEEGEAELAPPKALQDLNYQFVIVKDGCEEAIVSVEAPEAALEKVGKGKGCQRLTPKQMEHLQKSYPEPKLKIIYRRLPPPPMADAATEVPAITSAAFAVDGQGNKLLDTFQTVRSGFYLIDVLVAPLTEKERNKMYG